MALVLAAIRIYGAIAYTVRQRTREIGVRLALGASPRRILGTFLRHAAGLTALGLALGWVGAIGLTRYLSSLLHGVTATDLATFALLSFFLAVVAAVAYYVPARRAAKLDPNLALRDE